MDRLRFILRSYCSASDTATQSKVRANHRMADCDCGHDGHDREARVLDDSADLVLVIEAAGSYRYTLAHPSRAFHSAVTGQEHPDS